MLLPYAFKWKSFYSRLARVQNSISSNFDTYTYAYIQSQQIEINKDFHDLYMIQKIVFVILKV